MITVRSETSYFGSGHCCRCSVVCAHVGGPWFCAEHKPTGGEEPVRRAYQLGPDWYAMWQAEAAKFQAETLTTSFLAALLREGDNVCHRCREQTGSVVHAAGDSREWLCSRCAFPPAAGAA